MVAETTFRRVRRLLIMRTMLVSLTMVALAGQVCAQEFEAVSVKPSKSADNSSHIRTNQGRLSATNVNLQTFITMAFDLRDYQLEGPDWLKFERFDVVAKFPEALPSDRQKYADALGAMLRNMLEQRFKLSVHRDHKEFPVFALVVGKNGIKFKEVPD